MTRDPCADPLDPQKRRRVDAAARAVVEYMNGGRPAALDVAEARRKRRDTPRTVQPGDPLTDGEGRVLEALKAGLTNAEAARALEVSRQHVGNVAAILRAKGAL